MTQDKELLLTREQQAEIDRRKNILADLRASGLSCKDYSQRPNTPNRKTIGEWLRRHDPHDDLSLADQRWFVERRVATAVRDLSLVVIHVVLRHAPRRKKLSASEIRKLISQVAVHIEYTHAYDLPARSTISYVLKHPEKYLDRLTENECALIPRVSDAFVGLKMYTDEEIQIDATPYDKADMDAAGISCVYDDETQQEVLPWAIHAQDVASGSTTRAELLPDRVSSEQMRAFVHDIIVPPELHGAEVRNVLLLRFDLGGENEVDGLAPIAERLRIELRYNPSGDPNPNGYVEGVHALIKGEVTRRIRALSSALPIRQCSDGRVGPSLPLSHLAEIWGAATEFVDNRHVPGARVPNTIPAEERMRRKNPLPRSGLRPEEVEAAFYTSSHRRLDNSGRFEIAGRTYTVTGTYGDQKVELRHYFCDRFDRVEIVSAAKRLITVAYPEALQERSGYVDEAA